ncbi:uncharacterized protein LOC129773021 [Toxorhynchites rutilus septentrionalis]|uniref:uncharacterized protein LOC129773021 n=1 Tax=Toxorhynchites rutilus septentrionalis TaxID=329112 RepID=UPI0024789E1C|nr:uncharacterized protein LOC129773021 [Toxorhynchites rutilus septentrionalis]
MCLPNHVKNCQNGTHPQSRQPGSVVNYRGISILCCLGKVLETLVHHYLYNAAKPIVSENQHERRSPTTNLMCYVNKFFHAMENRRQVDSVYVDFSKAFDTVPHTFAIAKLKHIGFPDWITSWLKSYLSDRKGYLLYLISLPEFHKEACLDP